MSPRLLSRAEAMAYVGARSRSTFERWVRQGLVPPALPKTEVWDLRAIDARLDAVSGLRSDDPARRNDAEAALDARDDALRDPPVQP